MQLHTKLLCEAMAAREHDVQFITTSHPDKESEEVDGYSIHFLKGTKQNAYTPQFFKASLLKFNDLHEQQKFDIIQSESAGGWWLVKKGIPQKAGIPYVVTMHGIAPGEVRTALNNFGISKPKSWINLHPVAQHGYRYMFWERHYLPKADAVIAVSETLRDQIIDTYGVDGARVHPVVNGVDTEVFKTLDASTLKNELGVGSNALLSVGRVTEEKGVQHMLSAASELDNVEAVVGGSGTHLDAVKKQAAELKVKAQFFQGIADADMPQYYNLGPIFCMPTTRVEGLPFALLEAMSCGRAVIASRIGGIGHVIEDGKDGILIEPGSVEELVEASKVLLADPQRMTSMGEAARKKVIADYSVDAMVNKTLIVFQKLLAE
jgi:glycosyltransferase involved in cell wall biosynthesis